MRDFSLSRRAFISTSVAAAGTVSAFPAWAVPGGVAVLAFHNLHTGEQTEATFLRAGRPDPAGRARLDHALRDWRTGEVGPMDPNLYALLHRLRMALGARGPFDLISGYRSPRTNARLAEASKGGVAVRSLHMDGKAVDIALPGVPLEAVRDAALALQAGGVGYYPRDGFVHVDTGRVRRW